MNAVKLAAHRGFSEYYPEISGDFALEACDKSIAMLEEYGVADRIYINAWSGELLQ